MMMSDDTQTRDQLRQVQAYRKLVLIYEALDDQIDKLLMSCGGFTKDLSDADLARYHDLARKRDDVQNEIRAMEQQLMD
jgi:hypothetical protein